MYIYIYAEKYKFVLTHVSYSYDHCDQPAKQQF